MNLPDLWGEGILFAFSGLDGPTDWTQPFVGSTMGEKIGLIFHTQPKRRLWLEAEIDGEKYDRRDAFEQENKVIASDLLHIILIPKKLAAARIDLRVIFVNKDTLLGDVRLEIASQFRQRVKVNLATTSNGEVSAAHSETEVRQSVADAHTLLMRKNTEEGFIFAYSFDANGIEQAGRKAEKALELNLETEYEKKLGFFRDLPVPQNCSELVRKTCCKAFSVLKVNTEAPQRDIPFLWTTPDRIPHRNMWLWDSAFHSLAQKYISPQAGEEALKAVLAKQKTDGFIPHAMTPDPARDSNITQPPILAWAIWDIYQDAQNKDLLRYAYPRLEKYVEWDLKNRDTNGNGLVEWQKDEADRLCHCGESGMDNSPRFDFPGRDDAIDFNCFIVNEMQYLSQMANELGYTEQALQWDKRRRELIDSINSLLWDEADKFYYDRDPQGQFVKIKTVASFMPLFAGVAEKQQAEHLVTHLTNPAEFRRAFPVASVAADEPSFSDDMWRGPIWINYNYLIIQGLKRYGYFQIAEEIAHKTIEQITSWYSQTGVIFEYYDSEAATCPALLHRKGIIGAKGGAGFGVIRDYNWSAAIFIRILLEECTGVK